MWIPYQLPFDGNVVSLLEILYLSLEPTKLSQIGALSLSLERTNLYLKSEHSMGSTIHKYLLSVGSIPLFIL